MILQDRILPVLADLSLTHVVMKLKENHGVLEKMLALQLEFPREEYVVIQASSGVILVQDVNLMVLHANHLDLVLMMLLCLIMILNVVMKIMACSGVN